jgi:hypothetical protein
MATEQIVDKGSWFANGVDDLPLPVGRDSAVDSPEFWRYITAVRSVTCVGFLFLAT